MAILSRSNDRQVVLRGAAPDYAGLARKRASAPLMASKPQLSCDVGLFSDDADQLDLVDWLTTQSES
jgi:hypothetical protein